MLHDDHDHESPMKHYLRPSRNKLATAMGKPHTRVAGALFGGSPDSFCHSHRGLDPRSTPGRQDKSTKMGADGAVPMNDCPSMSSHKGVTG